MRACWICTLLLGLIHAALFPSSSGLEGGKKIGIDDVYKPRKWSQVRDGPYRMVVSSRDQESNETQLDSRKGTRSRQGNDDYREEKEVKSEAISEASDTTKETGDAESEPTSDRVETKVGTRAPKDAEEGVPKARVVDRRKHKAKYDQAEALALPLDSYDKNEKSTQRTITKLARKRERILSNENFRKAHRISIPEGHLSTAHPSTISHKLYNHFRPIDRGIPRESIIPFFDFGKKLSTGKPPSAINSIEGSSTPGSGAFEMTTHREDDDFFHEDMDVSVVKQKPVEWNSPPRARAPAKNPELTSYFRPGPGDKEEEGSSVQPTTPDISKEEATTTQISTSSSSPVEPTVTFPSTTLPPEQSLSDLQTNESKSKSNVTPSKQTETRNVEALSKTLETYVPQSTQLPRPSPTAKILSTAVVTSVSVKETYKHPRIKGINSQVEEIIIKPLNLNDSKPQPLKYSESLTVDHSLAEAQSNQTHRVDKSLSAVIAPSTHRPTFERFVTNKTVALLKNATVHPTTIRPKFRSNIEYHTFSTKVPTSTTSHKPVNRSLYSTSQRELHKNKFVSFQHHKADNRTHPANHTAEATSEPKHQFNSNENKTKMFLTIRSRLPNQSATYRSTFRRNGTKQVPPVLRVIATPSSYIEVPRIISRLLQNSTVSPSITTPKPTTEVLLSDVEQTKELFKETLEEPSSGSFESSTEVVDTTVKVLLTPTVVPKTEMASKIPDNTREVRMNNHRMPVEEVTSVQDPSAEITTEVVFHSLDTTTDTALVRGSSSPRPVKPTDEPNIVTAGPRHSTAKPKLSWVYLGQKNRTRLIDSPSVEVAYWSGFGIAAYVLAVLGIIPLILGGFILLRQILIKSKKKMLDESEYSSEYNRTPLPTKLPRITSHIMNWEGEKATSSLGTGQQSANQASSQHPTNHHQSTQHQSSHHQGNQHQNSQHQNGHHQSSHHQNSQHQSSHHQSGHHQSSHHQSSQHQGSHHQSSQHQNNQPTTQTQHQPNPHPPSLYLTAPGKWEFPRDKLRLQTLLGEGNFGQVWKAEADDISGHEGLTRLVAVKTVKEGSGGREREDLLRELGIMKELGSHPNVVTLLGCCTDREPFLLIMEYVMYGKMLTFLREHRTRAHYFNFSDLNSALVSRDLTVFAYCVARGMEFLVSKGIIHRDLAARNILVDHNKLCKIADFGMSRNVRDTGEIYEQRPNRGALPIRWMAPEALHCSVFTHKSDVWSFGILVWEIITLGCTPYQTMGAREVMRRVREGYRLERPIHCSQDLYKVITRCWAADSSKRPTFTEVKHDLATLLSDPQTNGACVDLDALTEEMSSHSC